MKNKFIGCFLCAVNEHLNELKLVYLASDALLCVAATELAKVSFYDRALGLHHRSASPVCITGLHRRPGIAICNTQSNCRQINDPAAINLNYCFRRQSATLFVRSSLCYNVHFFLLVARSGGASSLERPLKSC